MVYINADDFYKKTACIPPLTRREELEWARQMKLGEASARERLIRGYLPMVASHVKRLQSQYRTLGMIPTAVRRWSRRSTALTFCRTASPLSTG